MRHTVIARLVAAPAVAFMSMIVAAAVDAQDHRPEEGMRQQVARGTFEVKLTPIGSPGDPVGAMSIDKTFRGDLEGTSIGQMLAVRTPVAGSAGYVAMERVTGAIGGRRGSFALQHSGTMNKGAQSLSVAVVPDSGTDGLAGLIGSMDIHVEGDRHDYTFRYSLPN